MLETSFLVAKSDFSNSINNVGQSLLSFSMGIEFSFLSHTFIYFISTYYVLNTDNVLEHSLDQCV